MRQLDANLDSAKIVQVPHSDETLTQLTARGLVPAIGIAATATALTVLGIYACTTKPQWHTPIADSRGASVFTTPEGAATVVFLRASCVLLNMPIMDVASRCAARPEQYAEARAIFNLGCTNEELAQAMMTVML